MALVRWAWVVALTLILAITPPRIVEANVEAGNDPPAPPTPDAPPEGVVASISFADQADLQWLVAHYDVWRVDHAARRAMAWLTREQLLWLQAQGREVTVDEQTTRDLYASIAAVSSAANESGIPGFPCYRTVEETHADMAQLAAAFPTLVREVKLGESWRYAQSAGAEGYELRGLALTNQERPGPKPIFFLMGAIHAREYTTAEAALRFAEQLVHAYGEDPDATWLLDYTEIHVAPQTNPDGRKKAETGLLWRKNTNNNFCPHEGGPHNGFAAHYGVDLNRNSSFKWAQCTGSNCSSADPCSVLYRGVAPASEPETQALESYMRSIFADVRGPEDDDPAPEDASGLMISLHSFFPKILFPWGWKSTPAPNGAALQTLARKFGYYTGYPACQSGSPGCIYMTDGATDDFAYGELGVAAFTFELGWAFFESCDVFESSILTPTLASLTYAAKAAVRPYVAPAGPEVISVTLSVTAPVAAGAVVTLTATADDTRYYSGGYGEEPVQPIQAMRYTLNAPSWITDVVAHPMTSTTGVFTASVETAFARIDTTGWAPGRHLLFVEAQDADGVWGVPTAIFLDVDDAPVAEERRYFFPMVTR
ncbi:MAG: M14 family zinc carboxypeptidase [Caldilinea sp.]|jgi:carboxypeptidase T|uniref:M14 family zinc carboxypeptidase n=1 Tax=Caldilinea sp. TaxID=2293560 RepID=UPI0030A45DBE